MDPELLAILAAVARCVEETKGAEADSAAAARPVAPATSLWALNGRQSIMRMRALMQQRALKR